MIILMVCIIVKKIPINIFWFKRDLRILDNKPLYEASKKNRKLLLVYFLEENLINDPHYSNFHWDFIKQSIEDINISLGKKSILFIRCDPTEGLKKISEIYEIKSIYSHIETGIELTYVRDLNVKKYCDSNSIKWFEYEKNYVRRGLKNRKNWIRGWNEYVKSPLLNIDIEKLNILNIKFLSNKFNIIDTSKNNSWLYVMHFAAIDTIEFYTPIGNGMYSKSVSHFEHYTFNL